MTSGTETEDDECMTHGDDCPTRRLSTPGETDVINRGGSRRNSRRRSSLYNSVRKRSSVGDTLNDWAPYVGAVTAVGLGLLYTYSKH